MNEFDLDRAFEPTSGSFHKRMECALLKCKEDVPMKRFTLRTVLIAVLILMLLAGTALAIATHYSVKDYKRNSSEEYQKSITFIDKSYENEFFSLYVTDAVFDGSSISIAMDILPKEGAEPVYLYPMVTAACGGRDLPVDIEGCRGDFFSGFWVPDKEVELQGKYGVDACIYEEEADGDVQWALTFMVLKPNWELAYDQTVLHGDQSDPPMDEYMRRYRDAYAQQKILLADGYSLVEFSSILPAPEGMAIEEYQLQRLGPQLAQSEAFTLTETIECTWTASVPASYTVTNTGDRLEFDDYTIIMGKITTSFMKVTWAFDVYFKNGTGKEAGLEFEPRVGGSDAFTLGGGGYYGDGPSDDKDPAHYTYAGEFGCPGGLPDDVTFVPFTTEYREPTKEEAAGMVTPEPVDGKTILPFRVYNEACAFEVKLK